MKEEMRPDIVKSEEALIRKIVFTICDDMYKKYVILRKEENRNLEKQIAIYERKRKRRYPLDRILSIGKRKIETILISKTNKI